MRTKKRFLGSLCFLVLATTVITDCCLCFPKEHRIRVRLDVVAQVLPDVHVGALDFGTIASGVVTDYQIIKPGTYDIVAGAEGTVIGQVTINGWGSHDWTVVIGGTASSLTFTITDDPVS